MMCWLHS